jgi:hypothetical protein
MPQRRKAKVKRQKKKTAGRVASHQPPTMRAALLASSSLLPFAFLLLP